MKTKYIGYLGAICAVAAGFILGVYVLPYFWRVVHDDIWPPQPPTHVSVTASSAPIEDLGFVPSTPPIPQSIVPVPVSEVPVPSALNAYDTQMLYDMNLARLTESLPKFKENRFLDKVAADKLADLEMTHIFDHIGSDGKMSWHWFAEEGYTFKYAGENLAEDFPEANDAYAAYLNSPEHKANILNVHFVDVGLASDGVYEVVEFGVHP